MKINTTEASNTTAKAINAIGDCCSYEELRKVTIMLISAVSYLVGCIEGMQEEDGEQE